MFRRDSWQEIFDTIGKNKLRTFLTGFAVSWGLFMLVILLGMGKGLSNGFSYEFRNMSMNSISIWGGRTTLAYKGLPVNRRIQLDMEDLEAIKYSIPGIEHISGEYRLWQGRSQLNYKKNYGNYGIKGIQPEYRYLEQQKVVDGRFINEVDQVEARKVIVIAKDAVENLFGNEEPIHKWLHVNGIPFEVVGIYEYEEQGGHGMNQSSNVFIPLSAAQKVFHAGNDLDKIMFSFADDSPEGAAMAEQRAIATLSGRHQFDPTDERALHINNNVENLETFNGIFGGINLFILVIGAGTIVAGIVGVSNIMLVVIKERTREIGIRKAIGATPREVVSQIMLEALFVTILAGLNGLFWGVLLLEGLNVAIPPSQMFREPDMDIRVGVNALIILVLAGFLAGIIPAMQAAKVRPIEALRDE